MPPPLKPLARARRLPPLVGRRGVAIHPQLEEQLFRLADVLSEGDVRPASGGDACYFGSTMIRIDLTLAAQHWRGDLGAASHDELLHAIEGSVRCHLRVTRIACNEVARRVPQHGLGTAQVEIGMRRVNSHLHIDVDLEVPLLGMASRARNR